MTTTQTVSFILITVGFFALAIAYLALAVFNRDEQTSHWIFGGLWLILGLAAAAVVWSSKRGRP